MKKEFKISVQPEANNELGPGSIFYFKADGRVKLKVNDVIEIMSSENGLFTKAMILDGTRGFYQGVTESHNRFIFVDRTEFDRAKLT